MKITATFLDEITHDIPSNNWDREQWFNDFKIMKYIGIDTVVMIRCGCEKISAYPSKVLNKIVGTYPVYDDMVDIFLDCAQENNIDFFFGTYDASKNCISGSLEDNLSLNRAVIDEAWEMYGHRNAFKGWYLTFEICRKNEYAVNQLYSLAKYCKDISPDLPVLISPYYQGDKLLNLNHGTAEPGQVTLEEHCKEWDEILSLLSGVVDIVAFQDGQMDFALLPDVLAANYKLVKKYNMQAWSNVESFDRDMPFSFPPIEWKKMWWKMIAAEKAGYDKLMTFEFSHFLSPNSTWPSAKNLFNRYCKHFNIDTEVIIPHQSAQCENVTIEV
jgi:hypothetical protein